LPQHLGDLCATDGLALNCLVVWDHASFRSSWHGTHPGRSDQIMESC